MVIEANFFHLFGLEQQFILDVRLLEEAWKKLQLQVHPDKHAHRSEVEKRIAAQWAAHVNEAYHVLRSPLRRAGYMCQLAGVDIQAETNTCMNADFLMQQLEWREALSEVKVTKNKDALNVLMGNLQAEEEKIKATVSHLLDQLADYNATAEIVREWMFIDKFSSELVLVRDQLEDS